MTNSAYLHCARHRLEPQARTVCYLGLLIHFYNLSMFFISWQAKSRWGKAPGKASVRAKVIYTENDVPDA